MKLFTLTSNDSGQSLFKFLSKVLYNAPDSLIYKSIRKGRIRINGKKTADKSVILNTNDKLEVYINDEFFETIDNPIHKASGNIFVVYEDAHILICDKPQGQLSHPDENENVNTLITNAQKYLLTKGEYDPQLENSFAPSLCHRLDRNTRGLVIVAKTFDALKIITEAIKKRCITKKYLCKINGHIADGIYKAYLTKNNDNQVIVFDREVPSSKEIITEVKNEENNLLQITLHTGRTHQIRAHLAYLGCPIVGDNKYGDYKLNKELNIYRQLLCAYSLTFDTLPEPLAYLSNKIIELDKSELNEFFSTNN